MGLRDLIKIGRRDSYPISVDEWLMMLNQMSFNGVSYQLGAGGTLVQQPQEVPTGFAGMARQAYSANGVVFACMLVRMLLFSEARFQFRQMRNGRPGDLFGTQDLAVLETPWPNGTTGDLLGRAIQDADLEGNFYGYRDGDAIRRLRPDWVTIVLGSKTATKNVSWALDAEIIGYLYHPGGRMSGQPPLPLLREDVAHFAPIPDPQARYRGMSWLTPIIREVQADQAATEHKQMFFENGATPNMIIKTDPSVQKEQFEMWVEMFREQHEGAVNAYRTLFLGGGSDAMVVGANMRQIDFKQVQGAGETRIAAAAGVPPVIVGLSEGLQAATYSNYGQARRRFADGTMRPLWRNAAASFATIINVPSGSMLWYDDRDVSFLAEDQGDAANIQSVKAATIHTLVAAGFTPDSVIEAVTADDFSRLAHTGLYSVQLMPAGSVGLGKGATVTGVPAPANQAGRPDEEGLMRVVEQFLLTEGT